ncbi:MAG: amidotransferase [Paludibacter sp.]|nr:amidotransferase [Paludibacter sp.]
MNTLSVHTFQHVPFEGLGCIEQWMQEHNHSLSYTRFYDDFILPEVDSIDWLIVMGGPMSVNDESVYPWLAEEKAFIRKAIDKGKTVIGICLGSQLIAEVLGSKVYPNHLKEIGWFDISLTEMARGIPFLNKFEMQFPVFHWHGDTYDTPNGSTRLMSSAICTNQAFLYNGNVLGLQFHLEVTGQSLQSMVDHGGDELIAGNTIQSAGDILDETRYIADNNDKMFQLLDYFSNKK